MSWLRHCSSERLTVTEPKGPDAIITNLLHQLELISHLASWFTKLTILLYRITTLVIAQITAAPYLTIFRYLLPMTPITLSYHITMQYCYLPISLYHPIFVPASVSLLPHLSSLPCISRWKP